jgi:hypothetical protein
MNNLIPNIQLSSVFDFLKNFENEYKYSYNELIDLYNSFEKDEIFETLNFKKTVYNIHIVKFLKENNIDRNDFIIKNNRIYLKRHFSSNFVYKYYEETDNYFNLKIKTFNVKTSELFYTDKTKEIQEQGFKYFVLCKTIDKTYITFNKKSLIIQKADVKLSLQRSLLHKLYFKSSNKTYNILFLHKNSEWVYENENMLNFIMTVFELKNIRVSITEFRKTTNFKDFIRKFLFDTTYNIPFNLLKMIIKYGNKRFYDHIIKYLPYIKNYNDLLKTYVKWNNSKSISGDIDIDYIFGNNNKNIKVKDSKDDYPNNDQLSYLEDTYNMMHDLKIKKHINFNLKNIKNQHDQLLLQNIDKFKVEDIKIHENFKKFIENFSLENYKIINNGKDLFSEGKIQKHCVNTYHNKINTGKSLILTTIQSGNRYTAEINFYIDLDLYSLHQFKGFTNSSVPDDIISTLKDEISRINNIDKKNIKSTADNKHLYEYEH